MIKKLEITIKVCSKSMEFLKKIVNIPTSTLNTLGFLSYTVYTKGSSILDVGCGLGDLYSFLQANDFLVRITI